jgi:membrane protease YdiL (CAAX protease family)
MNILNSSLIKQHALAIFCALTMLLTFIAIFLPVPGELVPVVIVFIPTFIAIALTALSEGNIGVRSLLGKLTRWRISFKWLAVAVALGFVMRLTISLIALGLGLIPAIQLRPIPPAQFIILALILFIFAIPEELGWRGYALPKLMEHRSPLAAGLIVGVLWGSLHLALHLPGMIYAGLPLLPTLLQLIGLSVLIAWLYMQTEGNILLTSLFHATQSFFVIVNEGLPLTQLVWLMAGVYLAFALLIVIVAGPMFTQKPAAGISQVFESTQMSQPLARK